LTDYARASQAQNGSLTAVTSVGGTADVVTGTLALSVAAYTTNMVIRLIVGSTNTTNVTINLNTIGAVAVEKSGVALVAGDWTAGDGVDLMYDGTAFQMLSPARTPVLTAGSILAAALATDSVITAKIQDNAVTLAKQAGGTANRLQGFDGSGDPAEVTLTTPVTLAGGALSVAAASDTAAGISELATDAEGKTGTATDRVLTPANVKAMLGFSEFKESSEITVSTGDQRYVFAHGLGVVPVLFKAVLICKIADLSLSVGDEVDVSGQTQVSGTSTTGLEADATNIEFLQNLGIGIPTVPPPLSTAAAASSVWLVALSIFVAS